MRSVLFFEVYMASIRGNLPCFTDLWVLKDCITLWHCASHTSCSSVRPHLVQPRTLVRGCIILCVFSSSYSSGHSIVGVKPEELQCSLRYVPKNDFKHLYNFLYCRLRCSQWEFTATLYWCNRSFASSFRWTTRRLHIQGTSPVGVRVLHQGGVEVRLRVSPVVTSNNSPNIHEANCINTETLPYQENWVTFKTFSSFVMRDHVRIKKFSSEEVL